MVARRQYARIVEQASWPVKSWFQYVPSGPASVRVTIQFFPNPKFNGHFYFANNGDKQFVDETLDTMEKRVHTCDLALGGREIPYIEPAPVIEINTELDEEEEELIEATTSRVASPTAVSACSDSTAPASPGAAKESTPLPTSVRKIRARPKPKPKPKPKIKLDPSMFVEVDYSAVNVIPGAKMKENRALGILSAAAFVQPDMPGAVTAHIQERQRVRAGVQEQRRRQQRKAAAARARKEQQSQEVPCGKEFATKDERAGSLQDNARMKFANLEAVERIERAHANVRDHRLRVQDQRNQRACSQGYGVMAEARRVLNRHGHLPERQHVHRDEARRMNSRHAHIHEHQHLHHDEANAMTMIMGHNRADPHGDGHPTYSYVLASPAGSGPGGTGNELPAVDPAAQGPGFRRASSLVDLSGRGPSPSPDGLPVTGRSSSRGSQQRLPVLSASTGSLHTRSAGWAVSRREDAETPRSGLAAPFVAV